MKGIIVIACKIKRLFRAHTNARTKLMKKQDPPPRSPNPVAKKLEQYRAFWNLFTKRGPANATGYANGFLAEAGHRAVPTFVKFKFRGGRIGKICVKWHLALTDEQVSALAEGWKGAETNPISKQYWQLLFQETTTAINEISRAHKPIVMKSRMVATFTPVQVVMTEGEKINAGYIYIDFT